MKMMCHDGQGKKDIDLLLNRDNFYLITNLNRLLSNKKPLVITVSYVLQCFATKKKHCVDTMG